MMGLVSGVSGRRRATSTASESLRCCAERINPICKSALSVANMRLSSRLGSRSSGDAHQDVAEDDTLVVEPDQGNGPLTL